MESNFENISEIRFRATSGYEMTDFPKTTEFLSRTRQISLAVRESKEDAFVRFGSSNSMAKEQKMISKLMKECNNEEENAESVATEEELKSKIIKEREQKVKYLF